VWEAFSLAGHLGLGNLTAIVDANGLQGLGRAADVLDLEPLGAKLEAFGWEARECDGHDHDAIAAALAPGSRPVAVVARTVKGYGVDFMEDELMWHYRSLRPEDRAIVFEALEGTRRAA
jgi:transketolase